MKHFQVRNWTEFQHYKKRNPPWIKLHRSVLDNPDFSCLQDASKLHLILIWLLASQTGNKLPYDEVWLTRKFMLQKKIDLQPLMNNGFIEYASNALAENKQDASDLLLLDREEESREETETEEKCKRVNNGEIKKPYGELGRVMLTADEHSKLEAKHTADKLALAIEILDGYIAQQKKDPYANHYAVLKSTSWVWDRVADKQKVIAASLPAFEQQRMTARERAADISAAKTKATRLRREMEEQGVDSMDESIKERLWKDVYDPLKAKWGQAAADEARRIG